LCEVKLFFYEAFTAKNEKSLNSLISPLSIYRERERDHTHKGPHTDTHTHTHTKQLM